MTFRSRSGGPVKKRGQKKQTHTRKLHHPPPPPKEDQPPAPPPSSFPLPSSLESGPFNPPDSEILALLHRALHESLSADNFVDTVQRIKGLLYDKKWLEVFCGTEGVLECYAGRWVPSRVCCFREIMDKIVWGVFSGEEGDDLAGRMGRLGVDEDNEEEESEEDVEDDVEEDEDIEGEEEDDEDDEEAEEEAEDDEHEDEADQPETKKQPTHHILSLGGGAGSEFLAIAALIRSVLLKRPHAHPNFTWTGIDIGNWHNVLKKMEDSVRIDWKIDQSVLDVEYIKADLLAAPSTSENQAQILPLDLTTTLLSNAPKLITLFFTLTELLTQSRPRTLSLLTTLTENVPPGTLFIVIDSASDISDFPLGKEGRKYPVYMIMDMLLTSKGRGWEKVKGENSRWYRFPEGVGAGWKVKLENTRYWYRLYRRV
ncbi:hypothetical protein I302_108654 [Kwoniella bestiolae CBS 10118]|uniref:Cytoplasmic protein n=1 Tax=Kwoniella bestiolae CBS 10118 TaxID=1296100 RepID=A0A1B9FTR7_9TREE|nr:cytoplasmic protein [Kwoniella bestiolae CBS 10118]OCF22148.1 cytoplasmic protein [Kwoniella bestiolae CBS 10118]